MTPEGCALYAHRTEVKNPNVRFHLLSAEGSDGHMTLIRRKGERDVNPDTFPLVEAFLTEAQSTTCALPREGERSLL